MQTWVMVLIAVVAVALVLTVYGALSDRAKNRRRAAEMLGPPQRDLPNLPADARAPRYVTEGQARRRPEGAPAAPVGPRSTHDRDVVEIAVGYASADFVTDPASREAVLVDPLVLVCDDEIETIRELLPALERALQTARPLVVVAPAIAKDVLGTLEVNAIQGKVPAVAVIADDAVRAQVATATGAVSIEAGDRHSGWLDPASFGHVARWTSTRTTSLITPAVRTGAAG